MLKLDTNDLFLPKNIFGSNFMTMSISIVYCPVSLMTLLQLKLFEGFLFKQIVLNRIVFASELYAVIVLKYHMN